MLLLEAGPRDTDRWIHVPLGYGKLFARTDVLFVQSSIDVENAAQGYWLFELIGGPKEDSYPVAHVLMAHGIEQTQGHQVLKH